MKRNKLGLGLAGVLAFAGCMRPIYDASGRQVGEEVDWGATAAVAGLGLAGAGIQRGTPRAVELGDRLARYGAAATSRSEQNVYVDPSSYDPGRAKKIDEIKKEIKSIELKEAVRLKEIRELKIELEKIRKKLYGEKS
ncbi:MAG: hypothetical protein ABIG28_01715 [archaeon]